MLVEFVYEGDARSVRVRGSVEALGGSELHRVGERWTTSLDVPDDIRATYWFALDGEEDWTRWLADSSNPKRYVYPAGLSFTGDHEVVGSLLEGPLAPSFRWSTERDVPHGVVEERELDGRPVWIYRPAGAPPEALLLLFDGREYTTIAPAPTVLDNLIAAGEIPPTAAVLPDSLDTKTRFRELGRDRAFLDWVVNRLLPRSGLSTARERTVVGGSSMGGVASLYFATERPDVFGNALVQSGGFPGMPVVVPPALPIRWYLDVGVLELRLLESTRELRDDLRAKGYDVAYREFPGGHDFFWWRETLADGLVALLRPEDS
ncbi:MAG: alpha/beta hydrolase [Gaiellaceae bacterium]